MLKMVRHALSWVKVVALLFVPDVRVRLTSILVLDFVLLQSLMIIYFTGPK